ncbi:MAG: serine protease [Prosthecobacter sp.]|nr:serine protease [Prosthecobacter sp.]
MLCRLWILCILTLAAPIHAQAPNVPVYSEGRGSRANAAITQRAQKLIETKSLPMTLPIVEARMKERSAPCVLKLPPVNTRPLEGREVWQAARAAHLRVGWRYLCTKCDRWHLDLAGGYAITADGAVATCAHVVRGQGMKEGYLIAVTEDDEVLPVTDILAASDALDTAIVRVASTALKPLPLAKDTQPGDRVWCFSDPEGKRGYFSDGIVSRFVSRPSLSRKELEAMKLPADSPRPVWVETTTDWAPGSSGSAIVDDRGNVAGHVSEIQTVIDEPPEGQTAKKSKAWRPGTTIVFHQGISAQTVRSLIQEPLSPNK